MCIIKFMFDYCADSCIWTVNREAENKYGEGIIPLEKLFISDDLANKIKALCTEYNSSLNWEEPSLGTVWSSEQIESFRTRAQMAYNELVNELGQGFEIQNLISECLES